MAMLLPRWLITASTAGRSSFAAISSSSASRIGSSRVNSFSTFATKSTSTALMAITTTAPFSLFQTQQNQHQQQHQLQQQRFRWTKAKKKRFERYDRRQKLAKEGIPLTKPPYYFPIHTPVLNAVSLDDRRAESDAFDKAASAALQSKQAAQTVVLRHHMSDAETMSASSEGSDTDSSMDTTSTSTTLARTIKLQMSDRVAKLFDLHNGCQREVVQVQKKRGMELFQIRPGDTGSSAVQVIALTTRIQQLQTHFGKHAKDKHSKRGMDALYVRRRKLLDYMERKDFESYRKVVKTLGLVR